jgi:hypothetical protein
MAATETLRMVMLNVRQIEVSKEKEATNVGRTNPQQRAHNFGRYNAIEF